jgi:hypothetical protein
LEAVNFERTMLTIRARLPRCGDSYTVMGQRQEPRKDVKIPVRIFGTDAYGKAFSANVSTLNVSRSGVCLSGVEVEIKPGETVGLTNGPNKARFTVKWVGGRGTPQQGQMGLLNLSPEKPLWDIVLPTPVVDEYGRQMQASDRRKNPRLKCTVSVELHPDGQSAPIWGKAADLSLGGCFVEMPMPLNAGTKLKLGLWVRDEKLRLSGRVVSSRPGFGIGVQFVEVSPEDVERLKSYLQSITRMPAR